VSHYYTPDPNLPHDLRRIQYSLHGRTLEFLTDVGVFSRQKVDYGSHVLIRILPPLRGRVLDLGCGYGSIGICLAVLNPEARIVMADVNRRAVALAEENIHINGVENAEVLESDGFARLDGVFGTIVSNPPVRAGKKVVYSLFAESIRFLEAGGSLWLVMQKKQGAASARNKLLEIYGNCEVIKKTGGYWILKSTKSP
jgi:16S rRNA (guanine1207-N2)-methyltransferase